MKVNYDNFRGSEFPTNKQTCPSIYKYLPVEFSQAPKVKI